MRSSLIVLVSLFASLSARAEAPCPPERIVQTDLDRWTKEIRAVKSRAKLNAALRALGLDARSGGCEEDVPEKVRVTAANAFKGNIDTRGREVRVINVLGSTCGDGSPQFQRGAVFVALGPERWCRIDAPFLDHDGSAYGDELCDATVFGFQPLVHKDRDALRVVETESWCGTSGADRGESRKVTYLELDGLSLRTLFSIVSLDDRYHGAAAVGSTTERILSLSDDFPRVITVKTVTTCMATAEELAEEDDDGWRARIAEDYPCSPRRTTAQWHYDGAQYVQRAKSKPKADKDAGSRAGSAGGAEGQRSRSK